MVTTGSSEASSKTNSEEVVNGQTKSGSRSEATYPYFPVQEGLRVAEAVQRAGGNSTTEQELMKALGLTSTQSHAWSYRTSTAREFGLVERTGRGAEARFRVTDLYLAYVHPGSDAEKQAALMQIVLKPPLYLALLNRYKGARPDATGVANVIWREYGILKSVKDDAAKAFITTIEFAGLITNGVVTGIPSNGHSSPLVPSSVAIPESPATPSPALVNAPASASPAGPTTEGWIDYVFPLRKGVTVKLTLPPMLTKRDIERLTRCIQNLPTEDEDEEFGGK